MRRREERRAHENSRRTLYELVCLDGNGRPRWWGRRRRGRKRIEGETNTRRDASHLARRTCRPCRTKRIDGAKRDTNYRKSLSLSLNLYICMASPSSGFFKFQPRPAIYIEIVGARMTDAAAKQFWEQIKIKKNLFIPIKIYCPYVSSLSGGTGISFFFQSLSRCIWGPV